ncbi:histone H3-like centromeric protein A [Camponotus floridanus]|uniref:histone H3-like centromeric protein A n=1 Tax=Camponotus floridanus TaxID=104421 RepID=UPI000DC694A7|nr:histone H3-like centromeric protein A [Camponotus floridanus]
MVRRKSVPRTFPSEAEGTERNRTNVIVNKRKRKSRVLQEIKHLRRTTHFLIPRLPFSRLIRQIMLDLFPRQEINKIQATALEALQEATEMYIVQFFEDALLLALHAKTGYSYATRYGFNAQIERPLRYYQ